MDLSGKNNWGIGECDSDTKSPVVEYRKERGRWAMDKTSSVFLDLSLHAVLNLSLLLEEDFRALPDSTIPDEIQLIVSAQQICQNSKLALCMACRVLDIQPWRCPLPM